MPVSLEQLTSLLTSGAQQLGEGAAVAAGAVTGATLSASASASPLSPSLPLAPLSLMAVHNHSAMDPLAIGMDMSMKMDFWSVYVFFNFLGCLLCAALIASVWRLSSRTSSDVLAAALCFSCFVMSASCGTQCLLNLLARGFAHGMDACLVEAMFHLISIISMFWTLALMALDSYRTVVRGESMGVKRALVGVAGAWAWTALGVGLFSLASPIYMAPSGVFCFFAFDSALMYAFFLPSFLIAVGVMAFCYIRIFQITRSAMQRMHATNASVSENRRKMQLRLAQKLFLFVLVFFASWIALVLGILVQLFTGHMEALDAIGGVTGVIHSSAVPISYGLINPRLRGLILDALTFGVWSRCFSLRRGSFDSRSLNTPDARGDSVLLKESALGSCKASGAGSHRRAPSGGHMGRPRISMSLAEAEKAAGAEGPVSSRNSSRNSRMVRAYSGAAGFIKVASATGKGGASVRKTLQMSRLDVPADASQVNPHSPDGSRLGGVGRRDSLILSPITRSDRPSATAPDVPPMELPNSIVTAEELDRDDPLLAQVERAQFKQLTTLPVPPLNTSALRQQSLVRQSSTTPSPRSSRGSVGGGERGAIVELSIRRAPSPLRAPSPDPSQPQADVKAHRAGRRYLVQHDSFGNDLPSQLAPLPPPSPVRVGAGASAADAGMQPAGQPSSPSDGGSGGAALGPPALMLGWPASAFRPSSRATTTFNSGLLAGKNDMPTPPGP